ncbi:MAG TPA: YcxB family protein [Novosphingobium sp.]|nr:YcxB family protein [Novosphingobium sp.]
MSGLFTTTYHLPDYIRANRLVLIRHWFRWQIGLALLVAFICIAAINFEVCCGSTVAGIGAAALKAVAYFVGAAFLAAIYVLYSLPRTVTAAWKRKQLDGKRAAYTLLPDGFFVSSHAVEGRFSWHEIQWWAEDKELVIVKVSGRMMCWFSKAQIEPALLDAIRSGLTSAHVRRI